MIIKGWIVLSSHWDIAQSDIYILDKKPKSDDVFTVSTKKRLDFLLREFRNKFVSFRYAVKNVEFEDITKELLTQLYGVSEEEDVEFEISDVTTSQYYNNIIGGHNISAALKRHDRKYIIIEIEEVQKE